MLHLIENSVLPLQAKETKSKTKWQRMTLKWVITPS